MIFKNYTIKILCVSFLLLFPLFSACQKSIIFKNVNVLASELKHDLNKSCDSLILNGNRTIYKVEIFNSGFSKALRINSKHSKIPVSDLPVGRYTVLVRLYDKLIAINLLRKEPFSNIKPEEFSQGVIAKAGKLSEVNKRKLLNRDKEMAESSERIKSSGKKSFITKSETKKEIEGYWVVKTSMGQIGTKTIRHFATKNELDRLVDRIHLEHKITSGKQNTLQIWEVYNLELFKKEHAKNRDYIKVDDSPYFNPKPIYSIKPQLKK